MFNFLSEKFSGVLSWLKGKTRLTDENISTALQQVEDALLEADVPLQVVNTFLTEVKQEVIGQNIAARLNPGEHMIKIVHAKLLAFLGEGKTPESISFTIPSIIMMIGLQGSGKTTSIAKLARWIQKQAEKRGKQRRILCASVDYYRPAAREQLRILASQIGASYYQAQATNPTDAAQEILNHFKQNRYEFLFLDTAGRLQVNADLMEELKTINVLVKPNYIFMVIDSMVGQESLNVARTFNEAVPFHSAILTKMDSDARGGVAFAFRYVVQKPLLFVGSGEKIDDFEQFHPQRMASRILGMGDIMSLIEKAEENVAAEQQDQAIHRLMKGTFTLHDFAQQLESFSKMGSLQKIVQYLPGSHKISPEMVDQGQNQVKQFRAIINSMTLKERLMPAILNASRKKRIAKGSGTTIQQVNQLLEKFEQSKQFVKMLSRSGKFKRFW